MSTPPNPASSPPSVPAEDEDADTPQREFLCLMSGLGGLVVGVILGTWAAFILSVALLGQSC